MAAADCGHLLGMTSPWDNAAEPRAGRLRGSLTFVGTATLLLQMGPFTLLTDPNFLRRGQRAYLGYGLWSRRLTNPSTNPGDLPRLDAIVLSHLHGDHFDRVARRNLPRDVPLVTTPQAAKKLGRAGMATVALGTWQRHQLVHGSETLAIEALPAVHAQWPTRALLPRVMGSLIEHRVGGGRPTRIYLSGDTLTGPHLDEIARRHPEVDIAVMHLGGMRVLAQTVTMDAAQGVEFLRRVRPQQVVPVHYDDYDVFRSPLTDFERDAREAGFADRLRILPRGQAVPLAWP